MIDKVLVKTYSMPPIDRRQALRYAGCRDEDERVERLLDEVIEEGKDIFSYKVCYREFPVFLGEDVDLGFLKLESKSLKKNLEGCERIVLFAATVGLSVDRMIAKYERLSPVKAVLLQGYGAERVEALCDAFCEEIKISEEEKGFFTRPRFSPGYGDLPIESQKQVVSVLDCARKIGVTLNESMLMSPSKSVTAFVGISKTACREKSEKCDYCNNKNCTFRSTL